MSAMERVSPVLIVDDDPTVLEMMEVLLSGEGYDVVTACNGIEALDRVNGQRPAVIILDMCMPVLDGYSVIGQLRSQEKTRSIPIIAISADSNARQRLAALHVDSYLAKPFDIDRLVNSVRTLGYNAT